MAATGLKTPQRATECTIGQIASSARNINYDEIANVVSDKKVVMIGEASHGTADFYRHRAEITKRLVLLGFTTVALEADFPDTLRVNNYVKE
jgi:erythromycin esterase-like protein